MTTFFRRAGRWLLLSVGMLVLAVTLTPLDRWIAGQLARNWSDAAGDVLIVLGGDYLVYDDTPGQVMIGPSSYLRSLYAAHAWNRGHFRLLVISGAGAGEEMKRFVMAYGVPEEAIRLETQSHSTRENAVLTQRLLAGEPGTKVLLTSDYHSFRAARAFRKAGLPVVSRPFSDVLKRSNDWQARWECFWIEMEECAKIAYYWWQGWI